MYKINCQITGLLLVFLLFILNTGCTPHTKRIDIIQVMFYRQIIHMPTTHDCFTLNTFMNYRQPDDFPKVVHDTLIMNKKLLEQISIFASRIMADTSYAFSEPSIHCCIHYTDRTVSNLCIDWFGNILIDGQNMGRSDTLCYLIRSYIGFYNFDLIEIDDLEVLCPEYNRLKNCELNEIL